MGGCEKSLGYSDKASTDHGCVEAMLVSSNFAFGSLQNNWFHSFSKFTDLLRNPARWNRVRNDAIKAFFAFGVSVNEAASSYT